MSNRRAVIAAGMTGLALLVAGCGGGGGEEAAAPAPTAPDPALAAAADPAAAGLASLGITAPDPADARLSGLERFGIPADVFLPRVSEGGEVGIPATTPSTVTPVTTAPATTPPATAPAAAPAAGTTTPEGSFTP